MDSSDHLDVDSNGISKKLHQNHRGAQNYGLKWTHLYNFKSYICCTSIHSDENEWAPRSLDFQIVEIEVLLNVV